MAVFIFAGRYISSDKLSLRTSRFHVAIRQADKGSQKVQRSVSCHWLLLPLLLLAGRPDHVNASFGLMGKADQSMIFKALLIWNCYMQSLVSGPLYLSPGNKLVAWIQHAVSTGLNRTGIERPVSHDRLGWKCCVMLALSLQQMKCWVLHISMSLRSTHNHPAVLWMNGSLPAMQRLSLITWPEVKCSLCLSELILDTLMERQKCHNHNYTMDLPSSVPFLCWTFSV